MKPVLFLKAAIPPGARWITVHSTPGATGQPVLIQPQADGSAHVIGGAGGSLNYLKLRAVRSESEYKQEAAAKQSAKREEAKAQRARDKEAGVTESKKKAREAVMSQARAVEKQFVSTVADKMGWDKSSIEFPEDQYASLSDSARDKLRSQHHRLLVQRARGAADLQRQKLVADASARAEAGIGEVPLDSPAPETLSVRDLDPTPDNRAGLGFDSDFKGRAKESGLTPEALQSEVTAIKNATLTPAQRSAAVRRGEMVAMVKAELKGIREPAAPGANQTLADAKDAVDILRAEKALNQSIKSARKAIATIDKSASEPKAFVLEYTTSPDDDAKIIDDINGELQTAQTSAFLSEYRRLAGEKPEETLGRHIGVGAYNSINSLALAVSGAALVDRSVVDVLGIAGAAQVLARRIHTDLAEDVGSISVGMQDFHLNNYMATSDSALSQARDLMDAAKDIELGDSANGADLQVAQELNDRRRRCVNDAQKIIGQSLGEMEANAALTLALKQGAKNEFQGSLGKVGIEAAIQRVRAIGLQRGDYKLDKVAGDTFLTINAAGMDRLASPVNREDVERVRRNQAIINGDHDEDGWLPLGVANRPDLAMAVKPGVAERLAGPFVPGSDLSQSLRDYIGARAADGDAPGDIVADIQSAPFFEKVGDRRAEYSAALREVAPLQNSKGKQVRSETLESKFNEYADAHVAALGGNRSTLNRQKFEVNQKSVDALHRALSEFPEGVAAFKQVGELTNQDQRTLREHFHKNIAKESPEQGAHRANLERLNANEPEKMSDDMFGDSVENPEWTDWKTSRDEAVAGMSTGGLDWPKYVESMHGNERAYESIQDLIRSNVGRSFAENFNKLNPGSPLKLGRSVIRNNLNHLDATDPAAREARMEKERSLVDSLRERSQGRYASGAVSDKLDAARATEDAYNQSQMGMFASEDSPATAAAPLGGDERHTLGHVAERQIAGMMGVVGQNFKPGQPTKLWSPTMSGGKNAARQRLVKLMEANKRVVAAFGTGSGKSLLQMASFTHLHQKGKVKRGMFLVPSIVQGQFSGEALRYLEPGKFKWHIQPGASRDERIAAYKDPSTHFCVMTHQSFRDDMMHLGAKGAGVSEQEMTSQLDAMNDAGKKEWMRGIMEREGINFDFLSNDESQYSLNRSGKENSGLANVVDSFSQHTPYYMAASGDPVKNDASEVYDLMRKMEPERYTDRDAFMRRYGVDTIASKDALKREMARYVYPSRIDPDVDAARSESKVPLSDGQKSAVKELESNFTKARVARMSGKVDVDAMKAISPSSFEGDASGHEAIAKRLQQSLGIMKSSAIRRVINTHADNPLADDVLKKASERKGKPGIVFAHNRESVRMLSERLEKAGHRVVTITGSDSSAEKEKKRQAFNGETGEPTADILVASDAGATGMNAQRGQWMYQFDTPDTAMTHAQRNGRIYRTGQKNNVELIDGVADHPEVHAARDRLQRKYGLRELMTSSMEGLDDTGVAHFIAQHRAIKNDLQSSQN